MYYKSANTRHGSEKTNTIINDDYPMCLRLKT